MSFMTFTRTESDVQVQIPSCDAGIVVSSEEKAHSWLEGVFYFQFG